MTNSEVNLKTILELFPNKIHIKINSCIRAAVNEEWKPQPQNNKDQHILFVKEGKGKYCFEDGDEILERGKLIYVSNRCPHTVVQYKDAPLTITGLRFDFYDNGSDKLSKLSCSPFHISTRVEDIDFYDKLCSKINSSHYFVNNHENQLICSNLISELLSEIFINQNVYQGNPIIKNSSMEKVLQYMTEGITKNYSIEELADKVGISARHLRSCFKRKYGITPKEYYLKIRMNYARYLLETSDISIKKVSLILGYSDQFVFSRQFKSFYGITPSNL